VTDPRDAAADPSESFDPAGAEPDPFPRFLRWWALAREASPYADAMSLATASAAGVPSARMVLLRGCDSRGFVFFTNYESAKARDLDENPMAALVFDWPDLHRQVRATGAVERLAREESEAYFALRPVEHRLSTWASPQSRPIGNRAALEHRIEQVRQSFRDTDVPLPPFWGGYRVTPETFEFWQGREHRLHDRIRYTRDGEAWRMERLAP
jgi:pyridoxamine 5'-phosphate oxidase